MKEMGATDVAKVLHTLQERCAVDEETMKAAFRLLFPGAGGRTESTKGEQGAGGKEKRWSERNIERVYWIAKHLWQRGFIKARRRYRRPGLQPGWQKVNWEYIADCYRRAHPGDEAATDTLKVTYGQAAKVIDAGLLFGLFRELLLQRCAGALARFYCFELSHDSYERFEEKIRGLLEEWPIPLPPAGDELASFALAQWERLIAARRALVENALPHEEELWEGAKQVMERFMKDQDFRSALSPRPPLPILGEGEKVIQVNDTGAISHLRCSPSPRIGRGGRGERTRAKVLKDVQSHGEPLTFQTPSYPGIRYRCRPYNVLEGEAGALYFLGPVEARGRFEV